MIVKGEGPDHRIGFVPLCHIDRVWVPIDEHGELIPDLVEAGKVCARHLHTSITHAGNAARKALERCNGSGDPTQRAYIELACEHLDMANTNAARLLDAPMPEDELDGCITPAEPSESANEMFLLRLLALCYQVRRDAGHAIDADTLETAAGWMRHLASMERARNENTGPHGNDAQPDKGGSA